MEQKGDFKPSISQIKSFLWHVHATDRVSWFSALPAEIMVHTFKFLNYSLKLTGKLVEPIKTTNTTPGSGPRGLAIDKAKNRIYIASNVLNERGRIEVFTLEGEFLFSFGNKEETAPTFNFPLHIALSDRDRTLYATDFYGGGAQVRNLDDGKFLFQIGTEKTTKNPCGITLSRSKIYMTTEGNHSVQVFDFKGNHIKQFGGYGKKDENLQYPCGITYSHNTNRLYICDFTNHAIKVWNDEGEFECAWQSTSEYEDEGQLVNPNGIDLDEEETLYITDLTKHSLQRFNSNGTFMQRISATGGEKHEIHSPYDVKVHEEKGRVYAVDTANKRIQVYT